LIYDEYNNWEKISSLFNDPPFFETDFFIGKDIFDLWYSIVATYISKKPDDKSMAIFLSKQKNLPADISEIMDIISKLRQDKEVVEKLKKIPNQII